MLRAKPRVTAASVFRQLLNSLIVSVAVTIVELALSCSAAYALSRFRFPGRDGSLRLFLFAQMFPGGDDDSALCRARKTAPAKPSGRAGSLLCDDGDSVLRVHARGYFDGLPQELEEAGFLDGGSRFDAFYRVVLPLARPSPSPSLRCSAF